MDTEVFQSQGDRAGGGVIMTTSKKKFSHPRLLSPTRDVVPPVPKDGDEVYGGIIRINVSALMDWLKDHPQPVIDMNICIWRSHDNKEARYVEAADITRPIIIAEFAPDYRDFIPTIPEDDWIARGYVCIDGHHRIEKARKLGIEKLPAIVLRMEQHLPYVFAGYERYVEYWNSKLADRVRDGQRS